jgi:hypothetical protein
MIKDLVQHFHLEPDQLIVASYDWRLPPSKLQERDRYFYTLMKKSTLLDCACTYLEPSITNDHPSLASRVHGGAERRRCARGHRALDGQRHAALLPRVAQARDRRQPLAGVDRQAHRCLLRRRRASAGQCRGARAAHVRRHQRLACQPKRHPAARRVLRCVHWLHLYSLYPVISR